MSSYGAETTAGLFDRFIFGIATDRWQWQAPRHVPERSQARFPMGCTVPEWAQEHARNWAATDPKRDRLQEIALRVALLSASANHESVVSQQCLAAAIKFVEWQERVRRRYMPGEAETLEARCTAEVIKAVEELRENIKWSSLVRRKHWYQKYGANLLSRVREALTRETQIKFDRKTKLYRLNYVPGEDK